MRPSGPRYIPCRYLDLPDSEQMNDGSQGPTRTSQMCYSLKPLKRVVSGVIWESIAGVL